MTVTIRCFCRIQCLLCRRFPDPSDRYTNIMESKKNVKNYVENRGLRSNFLLWFCCVCACTWEHRVWVNVGHILSIFKTYCVFIVGNRIERTFLFYSITYEYILYIYSEWNGIKCDTRWSRETNLIAMGRMNCMKVFRSLEHEMRRDDE